MFFYTFLICIIGTIGYKFNKAKGFNYGFNMVDIMQN